LRLNATIVLLQIDFPGRAWQRLAAPFSATPCRASRRFAMQRFTIRRFMSKNPRPDFKLSIDTQLLIERLRELNYGENITYSQLSELIGRDVRTEAAHILRSAIHYLAREEAIFIGSVRGTGVQRLSESEWVKSIPVGARKKMRNLSRRMGKNLGYAPDEKLSREEIKERNTGIAFSEFLNHASREKEARKIIEAAPDDGRISTGKFIDLLSKKAS